MYMANVLNNIKKNIKTFLIYFKMLFKKKYLAKTDFKNFTVRDNCVALFEFYSFHGEVLPGLIKYLLDLDYNVDLVLNKKEWSKGEQSYNRNNYNDSGLFSYFKENNKVEFKILEDYEMNQLLQSDIKLKYKHIILNSFYDDMEQTYLHNIDLFKLKPICMMHNPDIINEYFKTNKIISLVNMKCDNREPVFVVNSHYFGEFQRKEKSTITTFVTLNTKDLSRRNLYLLFEACDKLYERKINNFIVKIIGTGIKIPDIYHNNFQIFGFLNFEKMFEQIALSDFFLALIDQESISYTNKASGCYQLSYGFLKPILLHNKFSAVSGFTDENSILYNNNNELADVMEKCINMSNDNYNHLVTALEKSQRELYNTSLNNLKKVMEI